jgi:hypothetical protein
MTPPQILCCPRFHSVSAYAATLTEDVTDWLEKEQPYIISQSMASGASGMLTVAFLWLSQDDLTPEVLDLLSEAVWTGGKP